MDDQIMSSIFNKKFENVHFDDEVERDEQILVDSNYCFKKEKVYINLSLLWKVVMD